MSVFDKSKTRGGKGVTKGLIYNKFQLKQEGKYIQEMPQEVL